jgi:tetratricopeptide (TPR) repeat protein
MARSSPRAGDGAQVPESGSRSSHQHKGIFRKEGSFWTIGREGTTIRLKDTRGLGYIAHLLRHPNEEFHVLDLYGGIASRRDEIQPPDASHQMDDDLDQAGIHVGPGDAGEMLDEQAKVAYRTRLSNLGEQLQRAKAMGQVTRAEAIEAEVDSLRRELSRAVGLGGRDRRAASAAERARQSITKSIKSALDNIVQSRAPYGDHLSRSIKTGTFCCYRSDPDFSITWEFADTATERAAEQSGTAEQVAARGDRTQITPEVLDVSPFSLAERTAFVGRDTERDAIRGAIDRALSGSGSLVMLGGGPGVGKSRLAMEMAEYASRVGFRCVVGHCYERDEPFPYLPFVEIIEASLARAPSLEEFRRRMGQNAAELAQLAPSLRRVFPDLPLPAEMPPAQKRRVLFQGLSEALARGARTWSFVYVLEDLHWADESTLALLIDLANRVVKLPVVIMGTYRDVYIESNPALVRTLEELIRMGIRPLKLEGLSRTAVQEMLNGLTGRIAPKRLVDLIFDQSQGNPFFVEELYRHLVEEGRVFAASGEFREDVNINENSVPENVRLVIGRRLERFDESQKLILAAAAVIGRSFGFRLLNEMSQLESDELFAVVEKAQRMGIIVSSAEGPDRPFAFTHELVRQTILAGISEPRRQRLHASVADAIERLYPDAHNVHAGEIAEHLTKAGTFVDRYRLINILFLAGKGALEAAAFKAGRRNFRAALSHLVEADRRQRADLLSNLAISERGLEHWEAAFRILREALDIYIALGERKEIAESSIELTAVLFWAGRLTKAIDVARHGLNYLDGAICAARARLFAVLAKALAVTGNWQLADNALREAERITSALSDQALAGELAGDRLLVNFQFLRLKEAAANGDNLRREDVSPWEHTIKLQILVQTYLFLGKMDDAAKVAGELKPLASRIGQSYTIARSLIIDAWVEFGAKPDLDRLDATLRETFKSDPKVPAVFWDAFSSSQLSLIDFRRGDWAQALEHAETSNELEGQTSRRGIGVGTLFRQLAYCGDHARALAILEQKRSWLPSAGEPNTIGSWWMLALAIEGLFVMRDCSKAAELYPLAQQLLETGAVVLWPIFRFTQTVAAMAAAAAEQWQTAEAHFQTARRQAEQIPHRLEQAEIHRFHAMMLLARAASGDYERARQLIIDSSESYRCIGMRSHAEIAKCLLITPGV